jgi:hypothetical protein
MRERGRGIRLVCRLAVLSAAVCVGVTFAANVQAQTVTVNLTMVRASNNGPEFVDPSLGSLGGKLKKKFPYRNYRKVGSTSQSGALGGTLQFSLGEGVVLALHLTAYEDPVVTIRATVAKGRETVITVNLRVHKGQTAIISVPVGADAVFLAITPDVK